MIELKNYKINKEAFKNSYNNSINLLKNLLKLDIDINIDDILKLPIAKKNRDNYYIIFINKEINGQDIEFYYVFTKNINSNYYIKNIKISSDKIKIEKYFMGDKSLIKMRIYKIYYADGFEFTSYIKTYNFIPNTLEINVYNQDYIYFNKKNDNNYFNDINIYQQQFKLFYIINNKVYNSFPVNTKKYSKLIKIINEQDFNIINLKRLKIYSLYLFLNNTINVFQIKELMNLINSKILMLYLIN